MSVSDLPAVNASINTVVAVLLVLGLLLVKSGHRRAHQWVMVSAVLLSALFLASYLTYHALHGSTAFRGQGSIRIAYFTVLISHSVLAVVNLPFILVTLVRAFRGDFAAHRRVAKWTWLIWFYVAVTGPLVYWMLWQMFPSAEVGTEVDRSSVSVEMFRAAQDFHKAGNEREALMRYRKAAELGHVGSRCYAAVLDDRLGDQGRLGEAATASAALAQVLRESPEDRSCRILAARELVYAGREKEAIPLLEAVTAEEPMNAFFQASLGLALFRDHRYEAAANAFEASSSVDPTNAVNVYNAGYAFFLYGNYQRAKPLLDHALKKGLDPELEARAKEDLARIADTAARTCPMHPDVKGGEGDTCTICGMALE